MACVGKIAVTVKVWIFARHSASMGRQVIAPGSLTLIDEELKSGRLPRIGGTSLKASGNYNLAIRKGHRMGADLKRLIDFLTNSPS